MTLADLAEAIGAQVQPDQAQYEVSSVASLEHAGPESLSFLSDERHLAQLSATRAGAVLLHERHAVRSPVPCLISDNPHVAFAHAASLLCPPKRPEPGIHPSAVIDKTAVIDPGAYIGPQAVVEAGCAIGPGVIVGPGCVLLENAQLSSDVWLVAHVTIGMNCVVGARALIHPGVVIGADGFGLAAEKNRWVKVPQLGRVVLGDDVEIGANSTIDRGALEDTVIGNGVKIDNLVQIAHNVKIGDHTAIAGCVGIAGSSEIGSHCMLGGGVGVAGHLKIADDVQVTGMSLVARSLEKAGAYSSSMPAQPMRSWQRNAARFRHLDELAKRLKQIEKSDQ